MAVDKPTRLPPTMRTGTSISAMAMRGFKQRLQFTQWLDAKSRALLGLGMEQCCPKEISWPAQQWGPKSHLLPRRQMMRAIDENTITDAVLDQMSSTPDARLQQIMASLVRHLHAFAREVDLTPEEWLAGIHFLTEVGRTCTPFRQEFILLSDTLGMSSIVNALHDRRASESCTKSSLLGPFYRQGAPLKRLGDSIVTKSTAPQICVYGKVTDST